MNYTEQFIKQGKFNKEEVFIKDNLLLETIMGSNAYGCNTPESDLYIVGIFMVRMFVDGLKAKKLRGN
jgi:hypothetical protein